MNIKSICVVLVALLALSLRAMAADTTVTLSEVHLCCNNCVRAVDTAIAPVTGAKAVCDRQARTIALTAPDKDAAQKAVNALVAAGYFGTSSDSSIKVDAPSGAKDAKVQTMTVSGVHLCCNSCVTAVKDVLGKVGGVQGNTAAVRAASFNVTGDFNQKAVFDELNKAGLAGKVAAPAAN